MKQDLMLRALLSTAFTYRNTSIGYNTATVTPKEGKKCLLPDCDKLTKHNGGYCSAKHCKLHRVKMNGQV